VGYGSAYHECGHILWSPWGGKLIARARKEGGETLAHIMNIVGDRRDDMKTAEFAPGIAETLWSRLGYLRTMGRRDEFRKKLDVYEQRIQEREAKKPVAKKRRGKKVAEEKTPALTPDQRLTWFMKHLPPKDPYEDFFFAAKCHVAPRFEQTKRALRYLRRARLMKAGEGELLWIAHKIRKILGEMPERERDPVEARFNLLCSLMQVAMTGARGRTLSPKMQRALHHIAKQYVAKLRKSGMEGLLHFLKQTVTHPGPISVGGPDVVIETKKVKHEAINRERYNRYCMAIQHLVAPLIQKLKRIDSPSEFTLYGQDEGDLDLSEAARIAVGLPGVYEETVVERDIDAEIHLAIDCSGSMTGAKVETAKQIATLFSEAIQALPSCTGHIWAYSSRAVYDFGELGSTSGFVQIDGEAGNSDTYMLRVVGRTLAKSTRRRKILITLCDDGPDDIVEAGRVTRQLMARGIITVHMLVGVHGTPDIYPVELLYTDMNECLEEFGDLLEQIMKNLR
ncbi:hypothetical protein HY629_01370, partial [Candidatus Uhrbacteria bacterium]|nr:hypothetical protein [Candidatus Uhrbacteria bacterium]